MKSSINWRHHFARIAFTLLVMVAIICSMLLWVSRWVVRSPKFVPQRPQRWGVYTTPIKTSECLFHCASVGEVVAASCVVKGLLQENPDLTITITTVTATGAQRVKGIFGDSIQHVYLPYDTPWTMRRLLRKVQPKQVYITEVELWPNMLASCASLAIPTVLINARMTVRSAQRYQKIGCLFTPMLSQLTHVCAQGKRDYDQYLALGLAPDKLTLTNNVKFDQISDVAIPTMIVRFKTSLQEQSKKVLIAGSTHATEETFWLETYQRLVKSTPNLVLFIVPRHPERFSKVAQEIEKSGLAWQKWSTLEEAKSSSLDPITQVVLVDAMGVLTPLYSLGDIAFVGGSLVEKGGHNALEPASFGLPVLMGPHIFNNPIICQTLQEVENLHIVANTQSALTLCQNWLVQPLLAQQQGTAGQEVIKRNRGALDKTVTVLSQLSKG